MSVASETNDERVLARIKSYNGGKPSQESDVVLVNGKPIMCRRCKRKRLKSEAPEHLQFKTCNPCRVIERAQKRRGTKTPVYKSKDDFETLRQIKPLSRDQEDDSDARQDTPNQSESVAESNSGKSSPGAAQGSEIEPELQTQSNLSERSVSVASNAQMGSFKALPNTKSELQQHLYYNCQIDQKYQIGQQDLHRPESICIHCGGDTQGYADLCYSCENRDSVIKSFDYYLLVLQLNSEQELCNIVFSTILPQNQLFSTTPTEEKSAASMLLRLYEKYILPISKATGYDFIYQTESEFPQKYKDPDRLVVRETLKCVNEIDLLFHNDDIDSELMALQSTSPDQPASKTPCHSHLFLSYNGHTGRLVISFTHQPHK
ncbi:hypothetical protein OGAPHI_001987 [Ogataea philodendri]|uniref:Uncharacterized protein n=1 Tax=Ogataea philodendri TaxID=1378263 RepID=A0A9P8P9T6_9ASCO|nr:uncharacterized protein OGAPHI_001987 [Ogataea philodendri]KAH3668233.1 hypothetical protein OGAPHI_001987 [Ogataea philodendri]